MLENLGVPLANLQGPEDGCIAAQVPAKISTVAHTDAGGNMGVQVNPLNTLLSPTPKNEIGDFPLGKLHQSWTMFLFFVVRLVVYVNTP